MLNKLLGLFKEEEGQGMTEYAIVLGVIAVGAIGALVIFGGDITNFIKNTINGITGELPAGSTDAPVSGN